jgi:hypothetical protein
MKEAEGRDGSYFNVNLNVRPRPWSRAELEKKFNPELALAAFDTPEVAINPVELAAGLRICINAQPLIELRLRRTVVSVHAEDNSILVRSTGDGGMSFKDRFDHVVNALWEGRLAIDETFGNKAGRPWIHRLKYGVSLRLPPQSQAPPSATFISGPFGEVVSYASGLTYLTWYPECLRGISRDMQPPGWATYPPEPLRSQIWQGTLEALAKIVPSLRELDARNLPELCVKGGVIVAWGETDIYDPTSELHTRYDIGVHSTGKFHSINPGKLTMAPYFAEICACVVGH